MNILQRIGRLDTISPRQRKKFIWKICELINFKDRSFEIDFYDLKYNGHTKNLIDRYVYFLGAYEKGMLKLIQKTLSASDEKIFIDIGANVGHHTLFASQFAKKVYSFEPYQKVRDSLEEKLSKNSITNVTVVPLALGSNNEELSFFEPADFNTGTGSFIKDFKTTNEDNGLKLIVRNGTELFAELGIKTATLIKLDVEGFEASVIKGLLPFIVKNKPAIIMEYSKESQNLFTQNEDIKKILADTYEMKMFNSPNKINFKLLPWNFDRFGDVILTAKQSS